MNREDPDQTASSDLVWVCTVYIGLFSRQVVFEILEHLPYEPQNEISDNVVCASSKASDQPAQTRSLIRAFASHLNTL